MPEEPLDRIEVKIDRLTSRVDGLDVGVGGLETKIEKLTSRVEGLNTTVHKLTIMHEDMRDDVKRIADGVAATNERFERVELNIDGIKSTMDLFVRTQSAVNQDLRKTDADHERRIGAVEKRLP